MGGEGWSGDGVSVTSVMVRGWAVAGERFGREWYIWPMRVWAVRV